MFNFRETWCPPPKRLGDFNFEKFISLGEIFLFGTCGATPVWGTVIMVTKMGCNLGQNKHTIK